MRRVDECKTRNPAIDAVHVRRAGVTLGIVLALALSVPTLASGATIKVDETGESATFDRGGNIPKDYFDRIDKLSNQNDRCSLREAIEASNTNAKVDGCDAGDGPGDVVKLPAGLYRVYDNLFVRERVIVRGANAGTPGNDPDRGDETVIKFFFNPHSQAQVGMFWLGNPGPKGPADGGGSEFDGLTLAGNSNPLCAPPGQPSVTGTCEEWAIVQPEKSDGGPDTAPGFQLRNSIVRDFTAGVYLGGKRAVIARNLFQDNHALSDRPFENVPARGVDVYSDGIYTNLDPVVVRNVFANPVVAAVEYQGLNCCRQDVSGGLIRGNLVNMHLPPDLPPGSFRTRNAILLGNTRGQHVQDNVIRDPSPPELGTRGFPYAVFLDTVKDIEISGNTFTGLGTAIRVSHVVPPFDFTGVSGVRVANNRIYGNRYGFRVFLSPAVLPLSIDARANWWGANGGEGSNGARPGAPNPVNGVLFENGAPPPGALDTTEPLQLSCSMPAKVTANTPVPLTGRVPGMPSVDRTASTSPWFKGIHDPLMGAGISGVPGTTSGFDQPPSQGVSGGHVIAGGGSLTGTLVATAKGAGAGQVALDSEQVACPFLAVPEHIVIDKTTRTRSARPGDLITYRIAVTNRGAAPVRRLRSCDRAPRALKFVRATVRLHRAAGRRRCLMIRLLRPGQRKTFRATFRLRANVTAATVTNGAIADTPTASAPSAGAGTTPRPIAKASAKVKVKGTEASGGAPRVTG